MPLKLGVIGCGLKAAGYARAWVKSPLAPTFVALTDTSPASVERFVEIVRQGGEPKVYDTADALLASEAANLDAIYISTPHAFHAGYAKAALEHGLDLLLEKPMSLNSHEAREILEARERAGRQVVVAYQSSLSPLLRRMRERADAGEFGALLAVHGEVWENWQSRYGTSWKQVPALSGGGFIFDTGSHLFNAVLQMTGIGYQSVSASLDNRGRDFELVGGVFAKLENGTTVNLTFCGDTIPGCESCLTLFYERAILRVDIWGKWSELRQGQISIRETAGEDLNAVLEIFADTCAGRRANPSTAERSLHLAELWDLIKQSSQHGGERLTLQTKPGDLK
ncbi:Gfo/Idh/MocA family oxidoreductase [Rhizobium oryzihabitans]|jgi:predicted dehydrogenase|uniref:Gfo/Idh/MocA family oxidoreductase n=1 Tax=Rhizobium oryzihabitans TaxID=2267833 RepID=A0A7L5BNP3_9HYPH|nr:Gfo/Idh/MocA family oxidoreductase [Rhizobium oryzihabitans]MCW0982604.1 Gfo/Idh/MocA family oxidoreductase [Agrobacterium sp. BT-220-3]QCM07539.1 Gfo/Idh/MocA family oxidoreductase [Agrobacterium tumefaciens]QIB40530.1 Gfo/Idh/MocA family oxidoreductase [Rhizobium oryzihabitans]CUX56774.1 GFO/IDH/MocA family oxidoreductase [Agrobacterium genomosp. 5 str. CFBP 6626]